MLNIAIFIGMSFNDTCCVIDMIFTEDLNYMYEWNVTICTRYFLFSPVFGQENRKTDITIISDPASGRVTPGKEINFVCRVDLSIQVNPSVIWRKTNGDVTLRIARETLIEPDLTHLKDRYILRRQASTAHRQYRDFLLIIKGKW